MDIFTIFRYSLSYSYYGLSLILFFSLSIMVIVLTAYNSSWYVDALVLVEPLFSCLRAISYDVNLK